MIEITAEQAIESLRKVVKGNENKVVGCVYVGLDGAPACVVANALVECGASMELLRELDNTRGNAFYGVENEYEYVSVSSVLKKHAVALDGAAYAIFSIAQEIQDEGIAWGEALDEAEKVYADA